MALMMILIQKARMMIYRFNPDSNPDGHVSCLIPELRNDIGRDHWRVSWRLDHEFLWRTGSHWLQSSQPVGRGWRRGRFDLRGRFDSPLTI